MAPKVTDGGQPEPGQPPQHSSQSTAVQWHHPDPDRCSSAVCVEGGAWADPTGTGCGTDCADGHTGEPAGIRDTELGADCRTGAVSGPGISKLQGDQIMDHIYAFLTVASGYLLSFAVGAWIGRPLLDRLVRRILGD